MKPSLDHLLGRLHAATGSDIELDAEILRALLGSPCPAPGYTSSVDACLDLLHTVLPDWHWHVGHGANGIFPYATLSKGKTIVEADGTTVPLVLLLVIVKALLIQRNK